MFDIIHGFYLGSAEPIDNRLVVNDELDRLSIIFKYDGLRVFQKDTRMAWVWNLGSNIWEVESGILGVTGSVGVTGPDGNYGLIGNQGNIGLIGITGATGYIGNQGRISRFKGSNGILGLTGTQGSIGATGFQGLTGFQGYIGNDGFQGPTGLDSDIGPTGPTYGGNIDGVIFYEILGPIGETGPLGEIGITGATGFQGPNRIGPRGATGFQGLTGYQGPIGIGATGATGADGLTTPYSIGFLGEKITTLPAYTEPGLNSGRIGDGTIIKLDIIYDDNNDYATSSGIWTSPATEYYDVSFSVVVEDTGGSGFLGPTSGVIIAGVVSPIFQNYYCVDHWNTYNTTQGEAMLSGMINGIPLPSGTDLCLKIINSSAIIVIKTDIRAYLSIRKSLS